MDKTLKTNPKSKQTQIISGKKQRFKKVEEGTIYNLTQYSQALHEIDNFTRKYNLSRKKRKTYIILKLYRKYNPSLKLNPQRKKKKKCQNQFQR